VVWNAVLNSIDIIELIFGINTAKINYLIDKLNAKMQFSFHLKNSKFFKNYSMKNELKTRVYVSIKLLK
jgi:hypothetical protein